MCRECSYPKHTLVTRFQVFRRSVPLVVDQPQDRVNQGGGGKGDPGKRRSGQSFRRECPYSHLKVSWGERTYRRGLDGGNEFSTGVFRDHRRRPYFTSENHRGPESDSSPTGVNPTLCTTRDSERCGLHRRCLRCPGTPKNGEPSL